MQSVSSGAEGAMSDERCGTCRFFVRSKEKGQPDLGTCSAPVPGWIGIIEDDDIVCESEHKNCESYSARVQP